MSEDIYEHDEFKITRYWAGGGKRIQLTLLGTEPYIHFSLSEFNDIINELHDILKEGEVDET